MDGSSFRFSSPLSSMPSQGQNGWLAQVRSPVQPQPAAPTELAEAVSGAAKTDRIDPMAQSIAQLQALIERLNGATTAGDMADALRAIKDFVKDGTNASFIGAGLEQLSGMADTVLAAIEKNPSSVQGFSFTFNGSFAQRVTSSDAYYSQITSVAFSFSYADARTQMSGNFTFDEKLEVTGNSYSYTSLETATVSITTSAAGLESNPVWQAFAGIVGSLQLPGLEGLLPEDELLLGGYRQASALELMQAQFSSLNQARESTGSLIETLEALLKAQKQVAQAA